VTIGVVPFLILAAVAVSAALAVVVSRSAVYATLFLVINFSVVAVFYLALNAPFLAMVQALVYVGAVLLLFLFVILLLDVDRLDVQDRLDWQLPSAIFLTFVLLIEGGYFLFGRVAAESRLPETLVDSSPRAVGESLFDRFLLPFEIVSVLLLVAVVAVVALTRDGKR
jgi:NADH-quinone oxidoreductase subunit J